MPTVRDAYDRWSSTYDTDPNRTRDLDGRLVRTLDVTGLDVVEIGCGTGKNSVWLAPRCRSLVGLDLSEAMLEKARERVPGTFLIANITARWPLPDASADLVLADLVLEHIGDLRCVFAEARRVIRPGGRLRISELHPDRQKGGSRAHFHAENERVDVPAFLHEIADYAADGFVVASTTTASDGDEPPRLLIVELIRRA